MSSNLKTQQTFKKSLLKSLIATLLASSALTASTLALADSCSCSSNYVSAVTIEDNNDNHINQLSLMVDSVYYQLTDQNKRVVQDQLYEVTPYPDGRILAKRNGKFGLIGANGELIFDFSYDNIELLPDDLYLLSKRQSTGLVKALVKGADDWLYPASKSFVASTSIEQLYYDEINSISYFKTIENGKFGLINDQKQTLMPNRYDELELLDTCPNERLFISVKVGNKTGLIDQNQNFIVPLATNQSIENFNEEEQIFRVSKMNYDAYDQEPTVISEKLVKGKGNILIESDSPITSVADTLYQYSKDNKYGIINDKAEVIAPAQFDYISSNGYSPLVATKNAKQGILQPSGSTQQLAVNKYYDRLQEAYIEDKNLAELQLSDEEINAREVSGMDELEVDDLQQTTQAQYSFSEALYIAQNDSKFGLIDSKDTIRIPFLYDQMSVSMGTLLVKKNQNYGLLTPHNETVAGVLYDQIEEIYNAEHDSAYKVTQGNQQGIIDVKGKKILPLSAYQIVDESDNTVDRYVIMGADGKYGLLSADASSISIVANYEKIEQKLSNKNIIAQLKGKRVLLDPFGQVIPSNLSQYSEVTEMYASDNLKVVDQNGKQGVVSADGKLIISPLYDAIDAITLAYYSEEGSTYYYLIEADERYGLLDDKGKMIIKPKYSSLNPLGYLPYIVATYYDGNMEDVKVGLINAKGQVVKEIKYDNIYESYYDKDQQIVLITVADDTVEIYDKNLKLIKRMSAEEYEQGS